MFDSKYSKLLTILLIVGIAVIILAFGLAAFFIFRSSKTNKDAAEAVSKSNTVLDGSYIESDSRSASINGSSGSRSGSNNLSNEQSEIAPVFDANSQVNSQVSGNSSKQRKMYKGFPQVGTIEIPAISLSYPVLLGGDKAMEVSIIVYDPNQTQLNITGNVTFAGHNYRDGRFFANNKKIVDGDKIYIITGRAHTTEENALGKIFRKMLQK